jgi:hypothetical protein
MLLSQDEESRAEKDIQPAMSNTPSLHTQGPLQLKQASSASDGVHQVLKLVPGCSALPVLASLNQMHVRTSGSTDAMPGM